jgi:FkbM family methyltransferase
VAMTGPKVIAVEMIPENCLKLWTAVIANGLTDFRIIQAAASDNNGMISYSGADVSGSVDPHGPGAKTVCLTLDSILQSMPPLTPPLLVKIDVEGHESVVLRGASDTINTYRPLILFEAIEIEGVAGSAARATKLVLEQHGYKLYLIGRGFLVPKTSQDLQEGHVVDFLAVPPEKLGILSDLSFTVRRLSDAERLAWVTEMAENKEINHRRHAAGLLIRFAKEEPAFVKLAGSVLARLADDDELGPEMLGSLRAIKV